MKLLSSLLIALLFCATTARASVQANLILHWENMPRGAVNAANLPNGSFGNYYSWLTGTKTRWSIVAEVGSYPFPNPVVISNITWTGSGTNWLQNNTGAGSADEYLELRMPGNFSPTVNDFVMAGHVIFSTTNTSGGSVNLDNLIWYSTSGGYSVTQLQLDPSSGPINLAAHSGSGNAGGPTIQKGKVYFLTHLQKDGVYKISVYDPANNYAFVDSTQISTYSENTYLLQMPSGYIGDPPGTIVWGDQVFIFEPTAQQLTDLVTPTVSTPIIEATNKYDWSTNTVGIPGGIPNRQTIYTTLNPGATAAEINAAIDACPSNQVVYLNAGTYTLTAQIHFQYNNGVTLRGAGPTNTILQWGDIGQLYLMRFGSSDPTGFTSITAGATRGSTNITVGSTTGFTVGQPVLIRQTTQSGLIYNDGSGDGIYFISMITATTGTTITFWPPLPYALNNSPQAGYFNTSVIKMTGIEDMTLKNTVTSGQDNNAMFLAYGTWACWFKNVEFSNLRDIGMLWRLSGRCEVRHCYIHDCYGASGNGILLYRQNSFFLVEDNIGERIMTVCQTDGSSGNAFLYNYATNCLQEGFAYQVGALNAGHAAHCMFNLWEGNVANTYQNDGYHGSSSHNTVHRNFLHGLHPTYTGNRKMVDLGRFTYYEQVVGNVLGWTTWSNASGFAYSMSGEPGYTTQPVIYRLGYPNMGNNSFTEAVKIAAYDDFYTYPDTTVSNTANIHGNFDFKTASQIWRASNTNHTLVDSYFYPGAPTNWGNLPWPPFDPATPLAASATNIPAGFRHVYGYDPYQTNDLTAPTLSSATIPLGVGNTLQLAFSETVTTGSGGSNHVAVTATGGAVTAAYASGRNTATLTYNLSRLVASNETVTVNITNVTAGIADSGGNLYAGVTNQAVVNNSYYESSAPTPNPATIASGPTIEGATRISLVVTPATDAAGPINYQLELNGVEQVWQTSTNMWATNLSVLSTNYMRVRARDAFTNLTDWSSYVGAITHTQMVFSTPGLTNWTAPSGVTNVLVQAWGGGGAGGPSGTARRPGGGGGAYARSNVVVVPTTTYNLFVGAGTNPITGGRGFPSWFNTNWVMAVGGTNASTTAVGAGGSATASTGAIKYAGGAGGARSTVTTGGGGGGGGSGGYFSAGGAGGAASGTASGAAGAAGIGDGGAGGAGGVANARGTNGVAPGGGGGGQGGTASNTSGSGANGMVIVSWGVPDTQDPPGDTEAPYIAWSIPDTNYPTISSATYFMSCTVTDNVAVVSGTYSATSGNGTLDITNTVASAAIAMNEGTNQVVFTVADAAANTSSATNWVVYWIPVAPPGITITNLRVGTLQVQ